MKHWKLIGSLAVLAASAAGAIVALRVKQNRDKETIELDNCCPDEICPDVDMNGDPACFRMASKARVPDDLPVEADDDEFFLAFPKGPIEEVISATSPDVEAPDDPEPIVEPESAESEDDDFKSE